MGDKTFSMDSSRQSSNISTEQISNSSPTKYGAKHSTDVSEKPNIKNSSSDVKDKRTSDVILIETGLGLLDLHVYKRRWMILALYALLSCMQAAVWNQWGPIAAVSERVYGWTDGVIAFFANWGPIAYITTALLWSWLLDTKGLRVSCVFAAGLVALGTGLRCVVRSTTAFTWLSHTCAILNGISGPVAMGAVPKISAVWFPPQERATASAISYVFEGFGIGLTFLIGMCRAQVLRWCQRCPSMETAPIEIDDVLRIQQDQIMYYMYGTFAISAALFAAMMIYFPKEPPKPPSPSASTPRLDYVNGLKQLFRKWRFWQIGVAYGVSIGTRDAWSSMLDVNLKAHGISQSEAGWLGFYSTIAACVAGVTAGRFADLFQQRLRLFLIVLNTLGLAAFLWQVLLILGIIPESKPSLYAASILSFITSGALPPLFYELVCETAYPVSEGITNICLTTMNNIAALVFLGILSIPNIGTVWMNWLLVSVFGFAIITLVLLPEGYNRLDIDKKGEVAIQEDRQNHVDTVTEKENVQKDRDTVLCSDLSVTTA